MKKIEQVKFEEGKIYVFSEEPSCDVWLMGDKTSIHKIKIIKRTPKTVTFEFVSKAVYPYEQGRTYRKRIQNSLESEFIRLDDCGCWNAIYASNEDGKIILKCSSY